MEEEIPIQSIFCTHTEKSFRVTLYDDAVFDHYWDLVIFNICSPTGKIKVGQMDVTVDIETFTPEEPLLLPLIYNHSIQFTKGTTLTLGKCIPHEFNYIIKTNKVVTATHFKIKWGLLGFKKLE